MTTLEQSTREVQQPLQRWTALAARIVTRLVPHTVIEDTVVSRQLSPEEARVRKQLDSVPATMRNILGDKFSDTSRQIVSSQPAYYKTAHDDPKLFELRIEGVSEQHMWLVSTPIEINRRGKQVAQTRERDVLARFKNDTFSYDWLEPYETCVQGLSIPQQEQSAAHLLWALELVAEAQ